MPKPPANFLETLASHWEPRLRDSFLAAINDIRSRQSIEGLARLLENGDVEGVLRAVGLDPADLSEMALTHARIFHEGGMTAAQRIVPQPTPQGYRVAIRFDVRNLEAERWVQRESSRLVQDIVTDQRETIRSHLTNGLAQGRNPRSTALDLIGRIDRATGQRSGGVIGLHSTQERWLARYSDDLASSDPAILRRVLDRGLRDRRFDRSVAKAIEEGRGLPADIQAKMRTAYSNRALKYRGDLIARTETIRALGAAQTQAWTQALAKGAVDLDLITRFWVTVGDHRVRHNHRMIPGMNENGVGFFEPFDTPTGPSMHAPHDTDPVCRCYERIKMDYLARAVRRAA